MQVPIVRPKPREKSLILKELQGLINFLEALPQAQTMSGIMAYILSTRWSQEDIYATLERQSSILEYVSNLNRSPFLKKPLQLLVYDTFNNQQLHTIGFGWAFWNLHAIENRMNHNDNQAWNTHYVSEPFIIYLPPKEEKIDMPPEFSMFIPYKIHIHSLYTHPLEPADIILSIYGCRHYSNDNEIHGNMHDDYIKYPIDQDAAIHYNGLLNKHYSLYDVEVTEEIATTPAELLDPRIIIEQDNAEVRYAIVRKIGIERVLKDLKAEVLDTQGTYQLVNLDLGDGARRPYLKMLNPTTEEWHIEGVPARCERCPYGSLWTSQDCPHCDEHKGCNTVKKALFFRNGTNDVPKQLT